MRNFFLIKDLASKTGYSIYTIKYYLKIGLIKEAGRSPATNFRYFDDSTVKRLQGIRTMRKKNWPIRKIKESLNEDTLDI